MRRSRLLSSSEYGEAFNAFLARAVESEVSGVPLIGDARRRKTKHSGNTRQVFATVWDRKPTVSEVNLRWDAKSIRRGDVPWFNLSVRALAEKLAAARSKDFTSFLEEGAERAGRLMPGAPRLTWDSYLEALEGIEIRFDQDGNFADPELIVAPGATRNIELSQKPADYEIRRSAIIERKREEWNATKRTRRLS